MFQIAIFIIDIALIKIIIVITTILLSSVIFDIAQSSQVVLLFLALIHLKWSGRCDEAWMVTAPFSHHLPSHGPENFTRNALDAHPLERASFPKFLIVIAY